MLQEVELNEKEAEEPSLIRRVPTQILRRLFLRRESCQHSHWCPVERRQAGLASQVDLVGERTWEQVGLTRQRTTVSLLEIPIAREPNAPWGNDMPSSRRNLTRKE